MWTRKRSEIVVRAACLVCCSSGPKCRLQKFWHFAPAEPGERIIGPWRESDGGLRWISDWWVPRVDKPAAWTVETWYQWRSQRCSGPFAQSSCFISQPEAFELTTVTFWTHEALYKHDKPTSRESNWSIKWKLTAFKATTFFMNVGDSQRRYSAREGCVCVHSPQGTISNMRSPTGMSFSSDTSSGSIFIGREWFGASYAVQCGDLVFQQWQVC